MKKKSIQIKISKNIPILGNVVLIIIYIDYTKFGEKGTMENNYPKILKRLSYFRRKMQLSQTDMKHIVGITQGEYSYVENGKTKLSGEMMEMLYAKGWDIDYIISGIDNSSFEHDLRDQFIEHPGISSTTVLRIA